MALKNDEIKDVLVLLLGVRGMTISLGAFIVLSLFGLNSSPEVTENLSALLPVLDSETLMSVSMVLATVSSALGVTVEIHILKEATVSVSAVAKYS